MIARLIFFFSILLCLPVSAQDCGRQSFNDGWTFRLGDDGVQRNVRIPHDWAVEGDFNKDNPSGTGGGALPGGIGWYEKHFFVDKGERGKAVRITFDGVYMNSTVWINGQELGTRPYGYISFTYDLTPYLRYGKDNVVVVKVDNSDQPNSRWYSGCGIYRNVWLTKTNAIHVAENGTYVTTTMRKGADGKAVAADVNIAVDIVNPQGRPVKVRNIIRNADKQTVAQSEGTANSTGEMALTANISNAQLWSVASPYLYTVVTQLLDADGKLLDEYNTRFGVRDVQFTTEGCFLNGEHIQIQGVCNHHDLGCLGAAVNRRGIERQLELLKAAGFNGIRCSHNPPAPELLELCDEMGFLVMDEAFDMWRRNKTAGDYARFFNQWHERDLTDFVRRDRNHPSVCIWSIGNEVLEQWSDAKADTLTLEEANLILNFGHAIEDDKTSGDQLSVNSLLCRKLANFVRALDPTRPITAGCNEPNKNNHLFKPVDALDIIGYNYHNQNIHDVKKNFPGRPFIITESNSSLMTRGYYRQNSDSMYVWPERWDKAFYDETFSCSSYENCHVPWGNTNIETLNLMRRYPWICGQFVWTGFDYIGEPTPYGWPARSSYFGIIDLAGFPKDVYWLYKSRLTQEPVLHLFPHWNFGNETYAGKDIVASKMSKDGYVDVWAYYNQADTVELYLNGKAMDAAAVLPHDASLMCWRVKYEPGELLAVAKRNGRVVSSASVSTAGEPAAIRLTPDRRVITADGVDLSFVTVEVVDKEGRLCPNASNLIHFDVTGAAFIAGVDNGSPISLERFKDNKRKAFYGKCLLVIQNNGNAGKVTITATGDNLSVATTEVICQ